MGENKFYEYYYCEEKHKILYETNVYSCYFFIPFTIIFVVWTFAFIIASKINAGNEGILKNMMLIVPLSIVIGIIQSIRYFATKKGVAITDDYIKIIGHKHSALRHKSVFRFRLISKINYSDVQICEVRILSDSNRNVCYSNLSGGYDLRNASYVYLSTTKGIYCFFIDDPMDFVSQVNKNKRYS